MCSIASLVVTVMDWFGGVRRDRRHSVVWDSVTDGCSTGDSVVDAGDNSVVWSCYLGNSSFALWQIR